MALEGDIEAKHLMTVHADLVCEVEADNDEATDRHRARRRRQAPPCAMSDPLYKKEVLRLAANAICAGRLPEPHGTGTAHNATCGDRVIVDIAIEDGRIKGIALETEAVCWRRRRHRSWAAARMGSTREEIAALHESVHAMLAEGAERAEAHLSIHMTRSTVSPAIATAIAACSCRSRAVLIAFDAVK